jgi:hypothetical protein
MLEAALGWAEYRGMTTRSRRVLALLAVGAAALTGCGVGQDHQAAIPKPTNAAGAATGDQAYLALLRDAGWAVVDQPQIIRVARAECRMRGKGVSNVDLVGKVARQYTITMGAARSQLSAAERAYCPQYTADQVPI